MSKANTRSTGVKFINPLTTKPERYTLDEHGSGNLFADTFANNLRYVADANRWYHYSGGVWREDGPEVKANQFASDLLMYLRSLAKSNPANSELDNFVAKLSKYNSRKTMIREARRVNPIHLNEFDNNPYLLNCLNCTLDLSGKTVKRLDHSPDLLLTKQAKVTYEPKAKCDRWHKFTDEVMGGNPQLTRYLQKALGYGLVGDTSKECLFLLHGSTTRNGKGTTMETTLDIMGDYGKTLSPDSLAKKGVSGGRASPDFARLDGVRFVNISEPYKGLKLNVALVKQLTGGDTVTARFLYQNTFEYRPQFKIFINSNHLMEIDDDTIFSSNRLKMIPFDKHFDEASRDETLKAQFKKPENASGILNWLLEGRKLSLSEGLIPPEKAVEALTKYRKECDTITLLVEQTLEKDSKSRVKATDLYVKYQKYCIEVGVDKISYKAFVSKLREKNLVTRDGTDGLVIRGYKFKDEGKEEG